MKALFYFLVATSSLANTWAAFGCNSPNDIIEKGVSPQDIISIVDAHNTFRKLIMGGDVPGQPRGFLLKRIQWDDLLSRQAQKFASSCQYATQPNAFDPRFPVISGSLSNLGQSVAMSLSNYMDPGNNWKRVLDGWFGQYKNYKYPQNADENTGTYTQIVWADTMYVGCGYVHFRGNTNPQKPFGKLYICFYGPSGNIADEAPYRTF